MGKSILALAGFSLCVSLAQADIKHWGYQGNEGPAQWGMLSPDYVMCERGRNQSPINIEGALDAPLTPLIVDYSAFGKNIVNNGHAIQVNFNPGNTLILDGGRFEMAQVHFHTPAENRIEGKSYPLEAHFVHADERGNLAVIGVMFTEGRANAGLAALLPRMPEAPGDPIGLNADIKPTDLMPKSLSYYRYSGSLTTPPCAEGVRWLILKMPVAASRAQIEAFEKIMKHETNRPIQPLNGRIVVK